MRTEDTRGTWLWCDGDEQRMAESEEFGRQMLAEMRGRHRLSPEIYKTYWSDFARIGPRHANVKRWMVDLGWTAGRGVLDAYLAPEAPRSAHYG